MAVIISEYNKMVDLLAGGDYAGAIEALGNRWRGPGILPSRDGQSPRDYGTVVMYCGMLTVELGLMGGRLQEQGKDMLSLSVRLLSVDVERVHIAHLWLGIAYERCGDFNEALAVAESLLASRDAGLEVTVCAAKSKSIALNGLGRPDEALTALDDVTTMVDVVPSLRIQGRYFMQRGVILRKLGRLDDALENYDIADEKFHEAKSTRYEAVVANNMARVYLETGDLPRAHVLTEKAIRLFREISDQNFEGMAWDESAQVYRKEGKFPDAERCARKAVSLLEQGDHLDFLAEAYTTLGTILTEIGAGAVDPLQKAAAIYGRTGNTLLLDSVNGLMWDSVLKIKRLAKDTSAAMYQSIRPAEKLIIERVLEKYNWRVLPAAKELKLTHRGLREKLKRQFPDLLAKIPPGKPHRRSIATK